MKQEYITPYIKITELHICDDIANLSGSSSGSGTISTKPGEGTLPGVY